MSRLPPSSPTSLPSLFVAFLAHAGVVVAGLIGLSAEPMESTSTPMIYVPIDLVTIDEMTNLSAVAPAPPTDESREAQEEENKAAPAPAALPPPEEDAVTFEKPKEQPKDLPKKTEANPAPSKPAKSFNSELDDILSSVNKDPPKQQNNSANTAPAAANEAPRLGAGDRRRMTASVEDVIRSQLISNGCWADHSDMADAKRLKATFRVWFGRNGKFAKRYEMISPAREPMGDPPLQAFVTHARRALDMCNNIGWMVPEEYFTRLQSPYLDIEFLPKIGAM